MTRKQRRDDPVADSPQIAYERSGDAMTKHAQLVSSATTGAVTTGAGR
jgi:hypothetical protein